ncbi:MAG: hypothetical protein ACKO1L_06620 [Brachymonas sp.]
MNAANNQLSAFTTQLAQIQSGGVNASAFVRQARAHSALLDALPEKYSAVYHDLLDRLESGALFSEESCSFSQRDLLDSLALWAEKAQKTLHQNA